MKETTSISVLPEGCLSEIVSASSPGDACRAAAISKSFNSAADSDAVWDQFLPPDLREIIARAVSPVVFTSKKQLYLSLSGSHILLDDGRLGFKLDKQTGKKCYILGARELSIVWGHDPRYWEWGHVPGSRFAEVGILRQVCWLEIQGKIEAVILSPKTTYVAYLVFQFTSYSNGLSVPASTIVSLSGIRNQASKVYLKQPSEPLQEQNYGFPSTRKDGWMEIELGEFYYDQEDDGGEVEMVFREITNQWKSGLIVDSIELRPK